MMCRLRATIVCVTKMQQYKYNRTINKISVPASDKDR